MSGTHRTVLVVEDDPELNSLVGAYAQICGFEYRAALNAAAAFEEIRRGLPSAVILDIMLPDLDGFEVCRILKSDVATAAVPVLLLTALDGADERARGIALGAAEYLAKPFDPDALMQAIRKHTGNGRVGFSPPPGPASPIDPT